MQGSLEYFNFGPKFSHWVMIFFANMMVRTQNNRYLSDPFIKTRAINQGCNISPGVFLLSGEILARKIKQNPDIKDVKIG